MGNYLQHVTLTTGRVLHSERSAVAGAAIEAATRLLNEAFDGGEPIVPGTSPPVSMTAIDSGDCLSVLLRRTDAPMAPPAVMIGVAGKSECGADLWQQLHEDAYPHELVTWGENCPPGPWCAARHERAGVLYGDSASWKTLQEFECCIAWAFLDRLAESEGP